MPADNQTSPEAEELSIATNLPTANPSSSLTVVGIGASAGGLTALRTFFAAIPVDSGITFVVVMHLSPEHESVLAELLQTYAAIPVTQVTTRIQMEPNHVYVIPPAKRLLVSDGALDLAELEMPHGPRMQIDLFFRSLAEVRGDGAAIILSGTGSDGAVGIQAIKEHGGLILVQSPEEAEYDGMPRNAMATGMVDVVGPVAELAQRLVAAKQMRVSYQLPADAEALSPESQNTLGQILAELRTHTGHDFSGYKRPSLLRRITRRMQITRQPSLTGYLHQLRQNGDEAQHLFHDLLIHVTQFFRDPAAWEALAQTVIPALFAKKKRSDAVRVWAAGCATGEEAYSLAILLLEQAAHVNFDGTIHVFASDLSEKALAYARAGTYAAAIAADVSEERLARFFVAEQSHYRVHDEMRNVVHFAQHNLLEDPPFSRMDLITCRNLLIYMQRTVQTQIYDTFHYALHADGYLFLGSAESGEGMSDLFRLVDKRYCLYQRQAGERSRRVLPSLSLRAPAMPRRLSAQVPQRPQPAPAQMHQQQLERIGPPSLLVDADYHVLHLSETVGRYLQVRGGSLTAEVLQLVRPELQSILRAALFRAVASGKAVSTPTVPVSFEHDPHPVAIWVRPLPDEAKQFLVFFLEDEEATVESITADTDTQHTAMVQQLEAELQQSQQALEENHESYETVLDELGTANEELRSLNEEYRSTAEELETSKEELQSLNEELQLVNQELKAKMEQVSQVHGDLQNLVLATTIVTLFLDRQLRVVRFTPGAAELFNLLPSDQNRPITDLRFKVQYEALEADARKVIAELTPVVREVQDGAGRWFLVHVRPYRTLKDEIMGAVITFTDVTASKALELERRASEARFQQVWEVTSDAMALSDAEGIVLAANPAYHALYGYSAEQVIGQSFAIIFPAEARVDALAQYKHIFASEVAPPTFESVVQRTDNSRRIVETRTTFLTSAEGRRLAMLSAIRDITERKQAEERLHDLNERLEGLVRERTQQVRRLVTQLTMSEQEERRRISTLLHEDLQQQLFSLTFQLTTLRGGLVSDNVEEMQQVIDEIEEALRAAIQLTRNLSVDLSPPVLHNEGLYEALLWLAAQMEQQQHLAVSVLAEQGLPLMDSGLRVLLFQFVRELLFNVVKHAGVSTATVALAYEDEQLRVEVSDQGEGFDANLQSYQNSQGLLNITQRIQLLDGRMYIDAAPGKGTRVVLYIPLRKKHDE